MPRVGVRSKSQVEFGDFQTPDALAQEVCRALSGLKLSPASVIEPTCGCGALLFAAYQAFGAANEFVGRDVNADYIQQARDRFKTVAGSQNVEIETADFFEMDWQARLGSLQEPLLIIGNPPWVTNSALGGLMSQNLPTKQNASGVRGIEALTGKSNFDISEWMLHRMVEWMRGREATLAMLCKTTVARKVLRQSWQGDAHWSRASLHKIDALRHFGASVDACLLVIQSRPGVGAGDDSAAIYESLDAQQPAAQLAWREGMLVADLAAYEATRHLLGRSPIAWRSGIKHDCARVFELRREGDLYRNGLGQLIALEPDYVFPMLKSSDLARGRAASVRCMLVTQRGIGDETAIIEQVAPNTWRYLMEHAELTDRRASSIYRRRPRFSVFGVGEYSFRSWKVAISGFYKEMQFRIVGPVDARPAVLDDTCCFLPCESEHQARAVCELLNSSRARRFFDALLFWDAKRPVTIELLQRLDLAALAEEVGGNALRELVVGDGEGESRKHG